MPMESKAQRRYLWATNPEVAQEFEDKTPKGKKLPEHKKKATHNCLMINSGSHQIFCVVYNGIPVGTSAEAGMAMQRAHTAHNAANAYAGGDISHHASLYEHAAGLHKEAVRLNSGNAD